MSGAVCVLRGREGDGRLFFLEPGGNPPDPPLQAWLAGGGYNPRPVMRKKPGSGASTKISAEQK